MRIGLCLAVACGVLAVGTGLARAEAPALPPTPEIILPGAPEWRSGQLRRGDDGQLELVYVPPPPPAVIDCTEPSVLNAPAWIARLVANMAPNHGLDPDLVLAVIRVESAFDPRAVSVRDARGLMQLIPDTARRFGVRDSFDPRQNVQGGMKYLRWLLDMFDGDLEKALAGYNAGENRVERYNGVPPFPETREYIARLRRLYRCGWADAPNAGPRGGDAG